MDGEDLVVVATASSEPEAEMVCELLRSNDIECGHRETEAIDSTVENFLPAGPQEILVREADLAAAESVLAARDAVD